MANDNKVTLEIEVDSKDAQAAIELFGKESAKVLDKAEKSNQSFKDSFKTFGAPVAAAQAAIAGAFAIINSAVHTFSDAIKEASQDQKQFLQIKESLVSTGDSSDSATQSIVDFADALEKATGVGDELAKQIFIDAKAFGTSTEEAKKLTKAAIDYAAATGIDAETAAKRLGMTLDGTVGKLGNLGYEFRNLTEEQLKNGAAIDLIAARYGGAAENQLATFEGATKNITNATQDLLKALGKIITESSVVTNSINEVADVVNDLADSTGEAGKKTNLLDRIFNSIAESGLGAYGSASVDLSVKLAEQKKNEEELIRLGEDLGRSSGVIANGFAGIVEQANKLNKSSTDVATFGERLASLGSYAEKSTELTGKALEEATKKAKKAAEDLRKTLEEGDKFISSVLSSSGTESEKLLFKTRDLLNQVIDLEKKGAISHQETLNLRRVISENYQKDIKKINEDAAQKEIDLQKKVNDEFNHLLDLRKERLQKERDDISKTAANPGQALANGLNTSDLGQLTAFGVGLTSNILDGAKGATKLVTSAIGGIADIFLPGIGGAVAGLAEQLAKGPEATKIMVREFVKAIPDIVEAIAESIPVVVEVFVDSMVNRGGAVRIGIAIAKAMAGVQLYQAIGKQIASGFGQLDFSGAREAVVQGFQQFADAIGQFGSNIVQGLNDFFTGLVQNLADAFKPVTDAINGIVQPIYDLIAALQGGKGGGKGILGESLGKIGIDTGSGGGQGIIADTGNRVASAFGFASGTDSVPAMLTPGERVVPVDSNVMLTKFLNRQESPTNSNDAMLMQILAAVSQPMIVKTEAKVNQSAFADIILQLNRQNARLSA